MSNVNLTGAYLRVPAGRFATDVEIRGPFTVECKEDWTPVSPSTQTAAWPILPKQTYPYTSYNGLDLSLMDSRRILFGRRA